MTPTPAQAEIVEFFIANPSADALVGHNVAPGLLAALRAALIAKDAEIARLRQGVAIALGSTGTGMSNGTRKYLANLIAREDSP